MGKRSNGEHSRGWVTIKGIKYYRIIIFEGYNPLTGKPKKKTIYGKTIEEANDKLKLYEKNHGKKTNDQCLGEYFKEFLWDIKKPSLKPSSFEKWEGVYRNYLVPNTALYNKKLTDIDRKYIQKVTNELLKTHTVNQVKTFNQYLYGCFENALDDEIINKNPVRKIVYKADNDVEEEEKVYYISEKDQNKLLAAIKGDELEGIIMLGLLTGMRLGEILALTENDINFKEKTIRINKSVKYTWTGEYNDKGKKIYEYILTKPKTKKSKRDIPLPDLVVPVIKNCIKSNKEKKLYLGELYMDNKLIFTNDFGYYVAKNKPNRHLKYALKKACIEVNLHFHSLRHIFVTNCFGENIPEKIIMELAGHEKMDTTMLYAEIDRLKQTSEFQKINKRFNKEC